MPLRVHRRKDVNDGTRCVDFISMPAFQAFRGTDHFYNVAFHELTHWTGHKLRLDRDLKSHFGFTRPRG